MQRRYVESVTGRYYAVLSTRSMQMYCIDFGLWRADFTILTKSVPNKPSFLGYTLDHCHLNSCVCVVSYINFFPVFYNHVAIECNMVIKIYFR